MGNDDVAGAEAACERKRSSVAKRGQNVEGGRAAQEGLEQSNSRKRATIDNMVPNRLACLAGAARAGTVEHRTAPHHTALRCGPT